MLSALQAIPTEGGRPQTVTTAEQLPYGWRYQILTRPDGKEYFREIPLTEEDFLDPQEGDRKMQRTNHLRCTVEIFNRLNNYYINDPTTRVVSDLKMEWGIPGLKNPAPDIAVIPNLRQAKDADLGSFKVQEQGTRPALVIEVMSLHYQGDDTVKVELYSRAGVKEYLIVNPFYGEQRADYHLTLYRLVGKQYQAIEPESDGRLYSETTGVYFGVSADKQEVILTVAKTGEKLLTAQEEFQARVAAEARAQQAQAEAQAQAQARLEMEAKLRELEARLRELEARRSG